MKKRQMAVKLLFLIAAALFYILAVVMKGFFSADSYITDKLYMKLGVPDPRIIIVSIEDSTLEEYGSFASFSREKTAELITLLNSSEENAPKVIGVDILFSGESKPGADAGLVDAVAASDNVVLASSNIYRGTTKVRQDGSRYVAGNNIVGINEPYAALNEVTVYGFTNADISADGISRVARLYDVYNGETVYSFDWMVLQKYCEASQAAGASSAGGSSIEGNLSNLFAAEVKAEGVCNTGFYYTGKPGEYQHFAMERVLSGEIEPAEFRGAIVLVGAYATGLGDAYVSVSDRAVEMYGVEIHANVIQALMEGRTFEYADTWIYVLLTVVLWAAVFLACEKLNLVPAVLVQLAAGGVHIGAGVILAGKGIVIPQIYFLLLVIFAIAYLVTDKYFVERRNKNRVLASFRKYVAPQVVDGLSKNEDFETKLGGRKKDIAVLFVDIRGFTPLSESLQPEQVVGILDEYLALTTQCIFKNNGTLDKFIGDATMAMFNAPFDLVDYEMWAIKTALDIRAGGAKMAEVLNERYGKRVQFGIGVNCGEAVVGNIGCDIRMDYTAIGDTVNTAARLEGKAAPGEILISPMLYERVKDRVIAEPVGEMALKGKAEAMLVYRVSGLREEQEEN